MADAITMNISATVNKPDQWTAQVDNVRNY